MGGNYSGNRRSQILAHPNWVGIQGIAALLALPITCCGTIAAYIALYPKPEPTPSPTIQVSIVAPTEIPVLPAPTYTQIPPITVSLPTATQAPAPTDTSVLSPSTPTPSLLSSPTSMADNADLSLPQNCSRVELTYWNPFTGPDGPFMGELVNQFDTANPSIKVTMTIKADYYNQLLASADSDALPDVAIVHVEELTTLALRHIVRPIDAIVQQIHVAEGDYPEAVWKAGSVAGKRYSIPLDIHPLAMFYNEDLMRIAGINTPPQTDDDFERAAAAMTSGGNYGFMITTGFPIQQIFQTLLHQYGGTEFNADGTKVTWNTSAGIQALQWMKDAQSKYSEPNLGVDAELNALKSGRVGMIWNGIWQTTQVTGSAVSFVASGTGVPQIGPKAAVWAGSHQFALPVHKKGEDKCKDLASAIFIKYLIDNSVEWAKAGEIPASNKFRNSAEFATIKPQALIAHSIDYAFLPPSIPGISEASAPLETAVSAVMAGKANIKVALDDAANQADKILAQYRNSYGTAP